MPDLDSSSLTDLLELAQLDVAAFLVGGADLRIGETNRETAAQLLADDAMRVRSGESPVLERWRMRRDGGPAESGVKREAVEIYASIGFGTPSKPANDNHLQGLVAELLWNRLITERNTCADGRALVHAHSVKPDPLEPGGDGLVIYKTTTDTLVFRLWEIKKHEADRPLSATIRRATKQLASRGREYIAKLAGPETIEQGGPLGAFYAELVELWLDQDARAGVGISVGTSSKHAPTSSRIFSSMAELFPKLSHPDQLEGIVIAVPRFPDFATRVREIVWSGL